MMPILPAVLNILDVIAVAASAAPKVMEDISLLRKIVAENRDPTPAEWERLNGEISEESAKFSEGIIPPAGVGDEEGDADSGEE